MENAKDKDLEFAKMLSAAIAKYGTESHMMANIFKYCLIVRNTDRLEEFLYSSNKEQFLKDILCQQLDIKNSKTDEALSQINKLLHYRIIEDGYVCHSTSEQSMLLINEIGMNPQYLNNNLLNIYNELKEILPERYFKTDLNFLEKQCRENDLKGWFFDRSPVNYERYKYGPEWFRRFVGDENYISQDYEGAIYFVMENLKLFDATSEQIKKTIEFVSKYWKIIKPQNPYLLLISTRENNIQSNVDKVISEQPDDLKFKIYTNLYFSVNDKTSQEIIPSSQITFINIEEEKKIHKLNTNESVQNKL